MNSQGQSRDLTDVYSRNHLLSVVILSYNRCKEVLITVGKLLEQQEQLGFNFEIIVVDNASADDTSLQVAAQFPQITLITKQTNNGIAGWNEGFKVAKGKYFFVLDDDSHIHSGLLDAIERMEANPRIGILAMQIIDENLQTDPNLNPADAWKDGDKIAGFIGCGAIIRRALYEKIGGYAEWIHVYTHEFEYAINCWNAGFEVQFCGKCLVVHRVSKLNRLPKMMRIFATRNELAIIQKYFNKHKALYLTRIFFNNLKFIKREGLMAGYYVFKGLLMFFKLKKTLGHAAVSLPVQEFYAANFWGTQPVFSNLLKRIRINK